MPDIRLIAMDMDGTLLDSDHRTIPAANVAALRAAHAAGIHLALASGRIPDDAGFFALDAGLPMHILALNGACCLDRPMGDILRSNRLPARDGLALLELLRRHGLHYGVFCDHTLAISKPSMTDDELRRIWGEYVTRPGGRTQVVCGHDAAQALMRHGVNKILAYTDADPAALPELGREIRKAFPSLEVTSSWVNNLEINPIGINKGTALEALARSLGIPMAQTMALGDNDNDIPMLRAAGVGVVMANGTPAARAAADYITASNDAHGVASAIRCLALNEPIEEVRMLT